MTNREIYTMRFINILLGIALGFILSFIPYMFGLDFKEANYISIISVLTTMLMSGDKYTLKDKNNV